MEGAFSVVFSDAVVKAQEPLLQSAPQVDSCLVTAQLCYYSSSAAENHQRTLALQGTTARCSVSPVRTSRPETGRDLGSSCREGGRADLCTRPQVWGLGLVCPERLPMTFLPLLCTLGLSEVKDAVPSLPLRFG